MLAQDYAAFSGRNTPYAGDLARAQAESGWDVGRLKREAKKRRICESHLAECAWCVEGTHAVWNRSRDYQLMSNPATGRRLQLAVQVQLDRARGPVVCRPSARLPVCPPARLPALPALPAAVIPTYLADTQPCPCRRQQHPPSHRNRSL